MKRSAFVVLLLLPALASAQQRRQSHVPIVPPPESEKPSALLTRRMLEAQLPPIANQMKGLPADAAALLATPFGAEIARKLREGDPALLALAEQIARREPEFRDMDSQELRDRLQGAAHRLTDTAMPHGEHAHFPSVLNPPPVVERERLTNQAYTERFEDMLRQYRLDGMAGELRDSPIVRDMLRDLSRVDNRSSNGARVTLGNIATTFDTLDSYIREAGQWLPKNLPTMPTLDRAASISSTDGRLPSLGFTGPSSRFNLTADGWTVLAVCITSVLAALALWRVTGPSRRRLLPAPAGFRLGPWPVDPARVDSREELIAAFEYLALLKFGPTAAHWHHRAVAARFANNPAARPDAEQLASLYEQARYAESVTAPWYTARGPLLRLAD